MSGNMMRERVIEYVQSADEKDVKIIFAFVENKLETETYGIDNEAFKELKQRSRSFLDGSAKMYSLEDAKKIAREKYKKKE